MTVKERKTVSVFGESDCAGVAIDAQLIEVCSNLEIGVEMPDDETGLSLVRELQRTRARVHQIWPRPDIVPSSYDAIFCELSADLPKRLPWSSGHPRSALVLVARPAQHCDIKLIENCAAHSIIHVPLAPGAAIMALVAARNQFRYECRLRRRVDKLDENLRTMRSVERAKSILMLERGMTEEEAYNFLRKQAMDRRASIGALATAIVDSQELLG
ncbi:MAG: ANTAR domain-containing protein [Rhodospirillales bacterium]